MEAWERFKNAVKRQKIDHVPVALIGTNRFYASIVGYKLSDVLFRPDKMLAAQKYCFTLFPDITFIPGAWPDYGVSILSAYGCRLFWFEDGMPQIKGEIISSLQDAISLTIPDPKTDGLMPLYLHTLGLFCQQNDLLPNTRRFAWSFGPGEMCSYFCGIKHLLTGFVDDKSLIHSIFEKATEGILQWVNSQLKVNPDVEGLLLTDDIAGMVSRKHYDEFIFPYHAKIRESFPELIIVFHNDTKSDHILESIAQTGFDVFNFGKSTDILKCRREISDKICLMGNIDPLDLMINGSEKDVFNQALACLKIFGDQSGYLLSVGGGLNQGIPVENIRALVRAVKEFS